MTTPDLADGLAAEVLLPLAGALGAAGDLVAAHHQRLHNLGFDVELADGMTRDLHELIVEALLAGRLHR